MHWKMFAFFARQRKLNQKLLDSTIQKKYLKKAWNGWQAHHESSKIKRIEAGKKKEADEYVEMISMKYQKEISTLQNKLSELTAEINASNQHKKDMQNQLKRAFMRGLCAMNLEAMDVLNPEDVARQGEMALSKEEMAAFTSMEKSLNHPTPNQPPQSTSTRYQTERPLAQPQFSVPHRPEQDFLSSRRAETSSSPDYNSLNMAVTANMRHEYGSAYVENQPINRSEAGKVYDGNDYRGRPADYRSGLGGVDGRLENEEREIGTKNGTGKKRADDVDDLYENMLREFNIKSDVLGHAADEDSTSKLKENRKVTIMSEPLVISS